MSSEEPEAYIIGWQPFMGLKIYLDSHPLIPRTETEWWTEQLLNKIKNGQAYSVEEVSQRDGARASKFSAENYASPKTDMPVRLKFLDLCAGSGAIGCAALKTLPYMEVFFGEVDPAHEATILKNIRENNLNASRADVRTGDLFQPFGNMKFDIIAVNPPYIPTNRKLPDSVAKYEPSLALRAGVDGLDVIHRIAAELPQRLAEDGEAWIECDSAHAAAACVLFTAQGLSAEILTDQYDRPRVLRVVL